MLKNAFLMTIGVLLINLSFVPFTFANTINEKETKFNEKIKSEIAKLGVGKDARIKVKLKDGTTLKGYVSETNTNEFVVKNLKTGVKTSVAYSQAKQVKGNNLSTGTIIVIGFIAFIVILGIVIANSAS